MKRLISIILSVCLLVLVMSACAASETQGTTAATTQGTTAATTQGSTAATNETVKFGMFHEMTGDWATNGERHLRSATMVIDQINAKGGVLGKKIELITADNSSTNAGAVTALEIMLSQDVDCLIGPGFSSMCLATADAIKAEGIPAIISGTSLALVAEGMPKNWFRNLPPDDIADQNMADFLAGQKGYEKFFILYENTTYGTGNFKYIKEALAKYNIEIIGSTTYNAGDTDYTAPLMIAEQAAPEVVIVFSASSADAAIIARQVKELDCEFLLQGSMQYGSGVTKGLAGDAMNGIYAIQAYNKNSSDTAREFNEQYMAKYNDPADHFNGWVRDAIYVLCDAMERAGTTEYAAVVKALSETKDLPGACGTMTCDERNELQHNVNIVYIDKGEYIVQPKK